MKNITLLLFAIVMALLGCEEETPKETGDLSVIVIMDSRYSSTPLENAEIYTKPSTFQVKTDAFGSALLKGLEVGSYEVFASFEDVGSGKATVYINPDELTDITITIVEGVTTGIAPTVSLVLPALPALFSYGEEINFSADVSDKDTPIESLKVSWESDLDGVIHSGSPGKSGYSSFSKSDLSRGIHTITLTVEDADGYKTNKTFEVNTMSPKAVVLHDPVKSQGNIELAWTKYDGENFKSYEIYRTKGDGTTQGADYITTINDLNTTTFTDQNPPLEYQIGYVVKITNVEGYSRKSNEVIIEYPGGPIFNFTASDMLKHPTEAFVYLVDKSGQRLLKFDYLNYEKVADVNIQGSVGKCDIGDNGEGVEIYVPSSDGYVYVYDAGTLTLNTKISTGKVNSSVAIDGEGHVVIALDPSPDAWWTDPLRTFSRTSGMLIDGNGDFERDIIRRIPGKSEFISISTGVSPIDMDYYKLAEDGTFEMHKDDSYHGDYALNPKIFRISDDGTYVITSSSGAVYLANSSMEYKGSLNSGSLNYSDFAFSSDGSVIYAATSNRNSIQIGSYPSLIRNDEILLKGYPVFVVRDGKKLITLSKSSENSNITAIEVVDIE